MLAHPFEAAARNGRFCRLFVPNPPRAGKATLVHLRVEDPDGHREDRRDVRYHFTLLLVDPRTGKPLIEPATGRPMVPVEGWCKTSGEVKVELHLPVPGPVTARVTAVSDEGVTLHAVETLKVLP